LPDAADFLLALRGHPFLFVTNNPVSSPRQVARKLADLGLGRFDADRILTSAEATARWLAERRPGFRYFAVGGEGLHQALARYGTADHHHAHYVVVGEGPGLDHATLTQGIGLVLSKGAQLIATNPDPNVDDGDRILPGGGALVAPFEVATGRKAVVIGKPEPPLFHMALARLGCPPQACIMVGDRPDTDIAGAAAQGMATALVRTGRFPPGAPWPSALPRPTWDCNSLTELKRELEHAGVLSPSP